MREVSNALDIDFGNYHSPRAGVKPPFSALRHQNSMDQSSLIERDGVRTLEEARFLTPGRHLVAGGERWGSVPHLLRHLLRVRSTSQAAWKKPHL